MNPNTSEAQAILEGDNALANSACFETCGRFEFFWSGAYDEGATVQGMFLSCAS